MNGPVLHPAKPFSTACERNQGPILEQLRHHLAELPAPARRSTPLVLEIGSGTGQHAVHFARHLPDLVWQPSDLAENLPGIRLWVDEAELPNLRPPLELDVSRDRWPVTDPDAVFSANTAHIMAWNRVEAMFAGVATRLPPGGRFVLYGPFNVGGEFTSEGNRALDAWARDAFEGGGLRDLEAIVALGESRGLTHLADVAMPANNRLQVFRRKEPASRGDR